MEWDWRGLEGVSLIVAVVVGLVILGLYIWSIVWAYKDAKRRDQYPILVALMVAFLSWPLGLIIWILIRRR